MIRLRITQRTEENHFDQEVDLVYRELSNSAKWLMTEIMDHAVDNTRIEVRKEVSDEIQKVIE